jgi:hypothetical protein
MGEAKQGMDIRALRANARKKGFFLFIYVSLSVELDWSGNDSSRNPPLSIPPREGRCDFTINCFGNEQLFWSCSTTRLRLVLFRFQGITACLLIYYLLFTSALLPVNCSIKSLALRTPPALRIESFSVFARDEYEASPRTFSIEVRSF